MTTTFTASRCQLDTGALLNGFPGNGTGGSSSVPVQNRGGGSCTSTTACIDYLGSAFTPTASMQHCNNSSTTVYSSQPRQPGNYGRCTVGRGTATEHSLVYYDTSVDARAHCASAGGTFDQ